MTVLLCYLMSLKDEVLPLELIVQVFNINHGRNPEILKRSKTLDAYSFFIKKVNDNKEQFSLEESVKNAVKYCIENNILKEFLKKHGSEAPDHALR